ncbi:hypothetical protein [Butyrivibrio proteoclasticus]|uniref:hypothetical protein n=1 Tax=Butyrivibrio proteoclasticus TaxID=43305 RepID=UPI00047E24CC|nr:hypothetical protein [Butyrivibrio proteoclasticus]
MKKRFAALVMMGIMTFSLCGCGFSFTMKDDADEVISEDDASNDATDKDEEADKAEKEADNDTDDKEDEEVETDPKMIFTNYVSSDAYVSAYGTDFTLNAYFNEKGNLFTSVDGQSGSIAGIFANGDENYIIFNFNAEKNALEIKLLGIDDNYEVEVVDTVEIEEFIKFADESQVLIAETNDFANGKDTIIIETRSSAYTFGDGVDYELSLVEICEDGTLDYYYNDRTAGSGDEDITSLLRASFNEATGEDFTQEQFEDAFYHGELLINQLSLGVMTQSHFKSYAAEYAEEGDWDSVNEIVSKLYDEADESNPFEWGTGLLGETF